MSSAPLVDTHALRREFSNRLSALYAAEVPLYGPLVATVREVNRDRYGAAAARLAPGRRRPVQRRAPRRHPPRSRGRDAHDGRLLAALGIGRNFYDLSAAGAEALPIIATAFRPVDRQAIEVSPFRVFCSLLRPDDERFFPSADLRRREGAAEPRATFSSRGCAP